METIGDLQDKWWYRLLKVVFVLFISFVFLAGLSVVIDKYYPDSYKELDKSQTKITCQSGNNNTYTLAEANEVEDVDIQEQKIAFGSTNRCLGKDACKLIAEKYRDIEKLCGTLEEVPEKEGFALVPDKIPAKTSVHVSYKSVQEGSIGSFILAVLSWILILALVGELIRRTFYYICLGRFFPKKS